MIQLQQPNLEEITDIESVYEAFLQLSRQLPEKVSEILDDINGRISGKETLREKIEGIQEFTHAFFESTFQPLAQRVADISPSSPDQRDHPLRSFNHEMISLPLNLGQNLIDQLLINNVLTVNAIKPYVTCVLIRNRHEQVFVALSSTNQPVWKK